MADEYQQQQITQYRTTAQSLGEAALAAVLRGDSGLARTMARQAAQWARLVVQVESGQKQVEPLSGDDKTAAATAE